MVEAKGRDAVMVRNMLHIMIASNEDWVIPAGTDERRLSVSEFKVTTQVHHLVAETL